METKHHLNHPFRAHTQKHEHAAPGVKTGELSSSVKMTPAPDKPAIHDVEKANMPRPCWDRRFTYYIRQTSAVKSQLLQKQPWSTSPLPLLVIFAHQQGALDALFPVHDASFDGKPERDVTVHDRRIGSPRAAGVGKGFLEAFR